MMVTIWSNGAFASGPRAGLPVAEWLFEGPSGTANNEPSKTKAQIRIALVTLPTPGFFNNCLNNLKLPSVASLVPRLTWALIVREASVLRVPLIMAMVRM